MRGCGNNCKESDMVDINLKADQVISHAEPLSVEITRGQRGGYGWTIKLYGVETNEVVDQVKACDDKLKALFLAQVEEATDESKEHTG